MKEIYKAALESMAEGVLILNRQGRVQYLNSAAQNILGIKKAKIGCGFFEEVVAVSEENEEFIRVLQDGAFRSFVSQSSRPVDFVGENGRKTLSLTTSFLKKEGYEKPDVEGVIAVFRDITEAGALRSALEALTRIKKLNLELEARNRILQDLTSTIKLDEVLVRIVETSKKLIDAQGLSLLRLEEGSGKLYFAAVDNETILRDGLLGKTIPADKGIAGWVANNKRAIISNNPAMDKRFNQSVDASTGFTTRSILAVPVLFEGRFLAVMEAVNKKYSDSGFSEMDLPPMQQLASCAAIAIRNAEIFCELRRISLTDDLTGLANSRHFYHVFRNYLAEAEKNKEKFAVVMMDMDNFKEVVDTYGHQVGSRTLFEISKIIRKHVPEKDIVCRFGGDEFVILLSRMDERGAFKVADAIRKEIDLLKTLFEGKVDVGRMTCSVGISIYPDHGCNTDELFQRADQAMYRIKNEGKNGIHVCGKEDGFIASSVKNSILCV